MKRADVQAAETLLVKGNAEELVAQALGVSDEVLAHCLELARDRRSIGGAKPKTPTEDQIAAAEMYQSGKSLDVVAGAFKRTAGWVQGALRKTGTPARPKGPKPKEERNAEIVRRFQVGETATSIARDMDITRERVRQVVVRAGLYRSQAETIERARRERDEKMIELHADGLTVAEIAERLGLAVSTVNSRLRKNGISTRKSKVTARTREALRMFDAGASVAEITRGLGYTNEACCASVLQRYGRTKQRRAMQKNAEAA